MVPTIKWQSPIRYSATSSLVKVEEGEERWDAPDHPQGYPSKLSGNESNRTVTCMVLKATANEWRHLALCHEDPFGICRSGVGTCHPFWRGKKDAFQIPFLVNSKNRADVKITVVTLGTGDLPSLSFSQVVDVRHRVHFHPPYSVFPHSSMAAIEE
ncbi:hypothetical protein TNCV_2267921 [Trichonephila clavipes]|nr:hypothetical protein TNCV_2267921 [Trichonephila clavipes]